MKSINNNKGITLIALIITIIVMLILVAVTINVALNGGLFERAKNAKEQTQLQMDREELLSAATAAVDPHTGIVDATKLSNGLRDGWIISENEENNEVVSYTCISPNGNEFTVNTRGMITYVGASSEGGGNVTPVEPEEPEEDIKPDTYLNELNTLGSNARFIPYEDIEDLNNDESTNENEKYFGTNLKNAVKDRKISAIIKESINNVDVFAVIPVGYTVSSTENENLISTGLVIYDGASNSARNNEFVWIPVPAKDMLSSYNISDSTGTYSEPNELQGTDARTNSQTGGPFKYDSQNELDFYYGENYFNYNSDSFKYSDHYSEMVSSVNKYGGFYVGRYETTINGANIGTENGSPVLTANMAIKSGTNPKTNSAFIYAWWGMYYKERNANVTNNGDNVQTNMIWGQQWDKMVSYFSNEGIECGSTAVQRIDGSNQIKNAGVAEYLNANYTVRSKDIVCNIYDLRKNATEVTGESIYNWMKANRGGSYNDNTNIPQLSARLGGCSPADFSYNIYGSRLTLYIN